MRTHLLKLLVFLVLSSFFIPLGVSGIEIENPLKYESFTELIYNIINFLFYLAIPITSLMIVISAFYFLTSAGDPKKVDTAKKMIIWALVGLIILFLSGAIADLLKKMLGVK